MSTPSDERPDLGVRDTAARAPIRIDRSVVAEIGRHVGGDTTVEHGGVLVGTVGVDGVVTIDASIRAEHSVSASSSLTFTHASWEYINDTRDQTYPDSRIVGWYHSHPGFSVFLSEYDTFIQKNFFSETWQVAYVVDPLIGEDGFFGWEDGEIVRYAEWEVRAKAREGDNGVGIPAKRVVVPAAAPVGPNWSLTLAVGVAAVLLGLFAGIFLARDTSEPPVMGGTEILPRHDGLTVARTARIEDGCYVVEITVANNAETESGDASLVDPFPEGSGASTKCQQLPSGVRQFVVPLRGIEPGQSGAVEYSLGLAEDVSADAAGLARLEQSHRELWDTQFAGEPRLVVDPLSIEVGQSMPLTIQRKWPDGSVSPLLQAGVDTSGWSIQPPGIAQLGPGGVEGLTEGEASVIDDGGMVRASVKVQAPASAASSTTVPLSSSVDIPEESTGSEATTQIPTESTPSAGPGTSTVASAGEAQTDE